MIFIQGKICLGTGALLLLYCIYCATSAYRHNAKRKTDDPEKEDFSPLSPWLTPATPLIWLGRMILIAPWSILFGIFLIVFPFILLIFRPLPEEDPGKRFVIKVGNGILKINSRFLRTLGLHPNPA